MTEENLISLLKKYYGYDSFRSLQREIIASVFEKKDSLVLMPTGGGKSICFQIPALAKKQLCIVISPLISLMKDQVDSLKSNGIEAAFINSSLTYEDQVLIEKKTLAGELSLLYVSPEKLLSPGFFNFLRKLKIVLFAIDEAHCISSWGHDFRPEYTRLKMIKEHFPQTPLMALTATADKITRRDIIAQLNLQEPEVFISSFDRPNISLTVLPGQNRIKTIVNFILSRKNQSGIIYCLSKKSTETVAEKLKNYGIDADYYHAGLSSEKRSKVQERFINDELQVVCATIAFGMGIDKSNVRWVIHYNLPKNIEGYYQEIGRCGRDGMKSEAVLFYTFADIVMLKSIIEESTQKELQTLKLERMQQYADSLICRRKILLNYFGEEVTENCQNCDICKNPPVYSDGTIIAQKALSALWWSTKEQKKISSGMLIDVLKGSIKSEIISQGLNKIKTYGAGKEISYLDWQLYLTQMLNLGLFDIAYDDHQTLRLTGLSREVLFNNLSVKLISPEEIRRKTEQQLQKEPVKIAKDNEDLLTELKKLRKEIADSQNLAAYMVFNDATLAQIAKEKPITAIHLKRISGVGEKKFDLYGERIINTVIDFYKNQVQDGKAKNNTYLQTFTEYQNGFTIPEIALSRGLSEGTIISHLIYLYENDYEIDLYKFVSLKDLNKVFNAIKKLDYQYGLKDIFEHLNGEVDYNSIKFSVAHFKKKK